MRRGFLRGRGMVAERRKVKSRPKKRASKRVDADTARRKPFHSKSKTVDAHERRKDFLTEPEVDRLMSAARRGRHGERDALMVLLMFRHGFRVTELVRLRIDMLSLDEARIDMRRLKGGLDTQQPLSGDELRAIKAHLRTRRDRLPWLFVNERGTPLTRQAINYLLRVAGEQAKLGRVHPHMLRHGCGFHLANEGYDTRLIQDYLGHRDPRHTARYTRTAARRFEGLWKR